MSKKLFKTVFVSFIKICLFLSQILLSYIEVRDFLISFHVKIRNSNKNFSIDADGH